jgi:hypothetical protein
MPNYDYEHKFNYRKGYLREDKVPAFISTALYQIEKKTTSKDTLREQPVIEHHYQSVSTESNINIKLKRDLQEKSSRVKSRVINLAASNESSPALRNNHGIKSAHHNSNR